MQKRVKTHVLRPQANSFWLHQKSPGHLCKIVRLQVQSFWMTVVGSGFYRTLCLFETMSRQGAELRNELLVRLCRRASLRPSRSERQQKDKSPNHLNVRDPTCPASAEFRQTATQKHGVKHYREWWTSVNSVSRATIFSSFLPGISLRLSLLSSYHPDLFVRDDPREEKKSFQFLWVLVCCPLYPVTYGPHRKNILTTTLCMVFHVPSNSIL